MSTIISLSADYDYEVFRFKMIRHCNTIIDAWMAIALDANTSFAEASEALWQAGEWNDILTDVYERNFDLDVVFNEIQTTPDLGIKIVA